MASEIVYQASLTKRGLKVVVIGRGPVYYLPCPARSDPGGEISYQPHRRPEDLHAIALAILTDVFGEEAGCGYAAQFAKQVIRHLPAEGWELLGSEIATWLDVGLRPPAARGT